MSKLENVTCIIPTLQKVFLYNFRDLFEIKYECTKDEEELFNKEVEKYLTYYLRNFGLFRSISIYFEFMDKNDVISVGSGEGLFERLLSFSNINVTCIDPLTMVEWYKDCKWGITPKYDYVKNAIEKEPKLIKQNLIINAPITFINQREGYDIEAIKLLSPNMIFLLLDFEGNSGSYGLIRPIIKSINDNIVRFDDNNIYELIYTTNKVVNKTYNDKETGKEYKKILNLNTIILKRIQ